MRKKLLSLALALVMCLGLTVPAFAAERVSEFTDVPEGAWYLDELDYAVYNGYISGTSATTFSPESTISRGQFVTIMGRMFDAPTDGGKTAFEDVPENAFYAPYVAWASSKGYVNGFSVKEFGPNNNISVEQMAAILDNYIRKEGAVLTEAPVVYTDMASVSRWAVSAVEAMARYNLLHVDASGNVNPQKQVSRAEAAVALVRLAKSLNLGVVPPAEQTSDVSHAEEAKLKVQAIHDELWASGAITSSMTDKEKAIEYLRWMCANTDYGCRSFENPAVDINYEELASIEYPWESRSAMGPLLLGKGVCEGLAKAYKELLDTEGITNSLEIGERPDVGESFHVWNVLVLDGEKYEVNLPTSLLSSKNADGTLSAVAFRTHVEYVFYPEEYLKGVESGFKPLTDAELQQLLEDMQAEYNASWGQ